MSSNKSTIQLLNQSTEGIVNQLKDLKRKVDACDELSDVFDSPRGFFRELHAIFSRFRIDSHASLVVLLELIESCIYHMSDSQMYSAISSIASDIVLCLSFDEVQEQATRLLEHIVGDTSPLLKDEISNALEIVVLNSSDDKLVERVKNLPSKITEDTSFVRRVSSNHSSPVANSQLSSQENSSDSKNSSLSSRSNKSDSSGLSSHTGLSSTSTQSSNTDSNGSSAHSQSQSRGSESTTTGRVRGYDDEASAASNNDNTMTHVPHAPHAPPGNRNNSPLPSGRRKSSASVMKLSFVPHSITEQWLLAQNADELRFVLEEIMAVYAGLNTSAKDSSRGEMPMVLKQILRNLSSEHPLVVSNGLKFMELLSDHCVEAFVSDKMILDTLNPKLHRYLEHNHEALRSNALKLSISLVAQLPFGMTDNFVMAAVEHKASRVQVAIKLASVSLLAASRESVIMNGGVKFGPFQIKIMRIVKAALKSIIIASNIITDDDSSNQTTETVLADGLATLLETESGVNSLRQYTDIVKDLLGVCLLALCPDEADSATGIFPDSLPLSFTETVFLGLSESKVQHCLNEVVQADITLRASGLSFPSMILDEDISSHVSSILAARLNRANSAASKRTVSDKVSPGGSGGKSTSRINNALESLKLDTNNTGNDSTSTTSGGGSTTPRSRTGASPSNFRVLTGSGVVLSPRNAERGEERRVGEAGSTGMRNSPPSSLISPVKMMGIEQDSSDVQRAPTYATSGTGGVKRSPVGSASRSTSNDDHTSSKRFDDSNSRERKGGVSIEIDTSTNKVKVMPSPIQTSQNADFNATWPGSGNREKRDTDIMNGDTGSNEGDSVASLGTSPSRSRIYDNPMQGIAENAESRYDSPKYPVTNASGLTYTPSWGTLPTNHKDATGNNSDGSPPNVASNMMYSPHGGNMTGYMSPTGPTGGWGSQTYPGSPGGALSPASYGGPGDNVDRSKLHVLKSRGSRRAHSAEVNGMREMESSFMSPAPSTSHDFRDGHKVRGSRSTGRGGPNGDGSVESGRAPGTTTVGNYMGDDQQTGRKVQPFKGSHGGNLTGGKKKGGRRGADQSGSFDTSEYRITSENIDALGVDDDDNLDEGSRRSGNSSNNSSHSMLQRNDSNSYGSGNTGGIKTKRSPRGSGSEINSNISTNRRSKAGDARQPRGGLGREGSVTSYDREIVRERDSRDGDLLGMLDDEEDTAGYSYGTNQNSYGHTVDRGNERQRGGNNHAMGKGSSDREQRRAGPYYDASYDNDPLESSYGNTSTKKTTKKTTRRSSNESHDREGNTKPSPRPRRDRGGGIGDRLEDSQDLEASYGSPPGGRRAPSALKPDSLDYLDTSEIEPSRNPSKDLSRTVAGLDTQEWPEIFHTLNVVRQLALHHQSLLLNQGKTVLHGIVQGVLKQVENLRSQISKNAVLTLGDMFIGLGSKMDGEVASVITSMVKRCGDQASSFLGETAEMTLCHLIDNASASRALAGLLQASENRNAHLRGKVAGFLHFLVLSKSAELSGCRELDALKHRLKYLLNDNTPEARSSSRDVVKILIHNNVCSRQELDMVLTPDVTSKALSMPPMTTSPTRSPKRAGGRSNSPIAMTAMMRAHGMVGEGDSDSEYGLAGLASPIKVKSKKGGNKRRESKESTPSRDTGAGITGKDGNTPSRAKASAAKRIMASDEELLAIPNIFSLLQSNQWEERKEGVSQMTDLVIKHMTVLRDASRLDGIMDGILDRLDDGSVKVQLHTLQALTRIHNDSSTIFPNMQQSVLYAILNSACSGNRSVSKSSFF